MSRSNESDEKKLFRSENETRCPSSSGSSNADDGDVLRSAGKAILSDSRERGSLKGGSEAPSDVFYEYLGGETEEGVRSFESNWSDHHRLCRVSADMKIVRFEKLNSDDGEIFLILDVPRRDETTPNDTKPSASYPKERREEVQCVGDGNLGQRYEAPPDLAKKFEEPALKVSARSGFDQPRGLSKVSSGNDPPPKPVVDCAKQLTPIKRDPEASQFEPVRKKSKNVAAADESMKCVSKITAGVLPPNDLKQRTRLLRRCSDLYGASPPVYTWSRLRTSTMTSVIEEPSTTLSGTPKPFLVCRENATASFRTLLGEENIKAVSSNGGDTSTSDGNDDELNSSNNDDSDSKAKKKNRCALCRKKVGLTGFECRCGGLYCGMHRYSDKHNCTFDYRQLGAQEIRRNNPVVIGEKIQKI